MELLDVKFRLFAGAGPHQRPAVVVHFKHVPLGFLKRKPEYAPKDEAHIAHQIYRVVVDNDVPDGIEIRLILRLGLGGFDGGHTFHIFQAARRP